MLEEIALIGDLDLIPCSTKILSLSVLTLRIFSVFLTPDIGIRELDLCDCLSLSSSIELDRSRFTACFFLCFSSSFTALIEHSRRFSLSTFYVTYPLGVGVSDRFIFSESMPFLLLIAANSP